MAKVKKKKASKPKLHSKNVSLMVSVGKDDRDRNIEDFVSDLRELLGAVPYGQDGIHLTVARSYYVVDGQVCLPEDYDEETQNFKPGTGPPPWAGGDKTPQNLSPSKQVQHDSHTLPRKEFDKKYGLVENGETYMPGTITPSMQRKDREEEKRKKEEQEKKESKPVEDIEKVAKSKKVVKKKAKSATKAAEEQIAGKPKKKIRRVKK